MATLITLSLATVGFGQQRGGHGGWQGGHGGHGGGGWYGYNYTGFYFNFGVPFLYSPYYNPYGYYQPYSYPPYQYPPDYYYGRYPYLNFGLQLYGD
jgi:hypothetical protein